ncbi:MAG: hypothetical protein U0K52_04465 [Clostridia bacterium]|nr:hypothetical protein [Clostridia bacterium]
MIYVFNREIKPSIPNAIEYSFVFNEKNCSFSVDENYLKADIEKIPIVFNPTPGLQPNTDYYTFCEKVIRDIVYKMANKEIKISQKITIDAQIEFIDYKTLEAE